MLSQYIIPAENIWIVVVWSKSPFGAAPCFNSNILHPLVNNVTPEEATQNVPVLMFSSKPH